MVCKYCGNELSEGTYLCAECGKENKPRFPWKPVVATLGCVVLLGVLAWFLYFGTTGRWLPKKNDVYYKENYTVAADQAAANQNNVVATMGEDKLTNGQLQVFYGMQIIDYLQNNGAVFDYTASLAEQVYDKETGLTWQQYFLETALNTWKQYRLVTNKAMAAGYTLAPEYQQELDGLYDEYKELAETYNFESVEALIHADVGPGCTFEDYKYYFELYYYGNLYYREMAEQLEVSTEEIEAYYQEHKAEFDQSAINKESGVFADIRQILIKPEGGAAGADGRTKVYTEDEFAACRQEIQNILDTWLAGEKTPESFAKLAQEKSEDFKTASKGGLYSYLYEDYLTTVDVRHILLQPEGGTTDITGKTTYTEEQWQACYEKAQNLLNLYLSGNKTEAEFAELAKTYTADGNASVGGIYMDVPLNYMVEPFEKWIFDESRQVGDTDIVKTDFGYHIMYFVHRDDAVDQWVFDESRKAGDYEIIKADDGWHLVYYVYGEQGWIRLAEAGVMEEKADKLLEDLLSGAEMKTKYASIGLGEADR